jgi:hypothetical protein
MHLQVSPDAPLLVQAAVGSLLVLHVGGGIVGIGSGAAALLLPKGGRWHRLAGRVFFVSMLIMAGVGTAVSPFLPQLGNVVAGLFTIYLVSTAWMAVRRKASGVGRLEVAAFLLALVAAAAGVIFGLLAAASPTGRLDGDPPLGYFVLAGFPALAAAVDLGVIRRGGLSGVQRITRHLWRMCTALFVASASLFLGQPRVFPASLRGSPIMFAPEILVLGLMIFWLVRMRVRRRAKPRLTAPAAA